MTNLDSFKAYDIRGRIPMKSTTTSPMTSAAPLRRS